MKIDRIIAKTLFVLNVACFATTIYGTTVNPSIWPMIGISGFVAFMLYQWLKEDKERTILLINLENDLYERSYN